MFFILSIKSRLISNGIAKNDQIEPLCVVLYDNQGSSLYKVHEHPPLRQTHKNTEELCNIVANQITSPEQCSQIHTHTKTHLPEQNRS